MPKKAKRSCCFTKNKKPKKAKKGKVKPRSSSSSDPSLKPFLSAKGSHSSSPSSSSSSDVFFSAKSHHLPVLNEPEPEPEPEPVISRNKDIPEFYNKKYSEDNNLWGGLKSQISFTIGSNNTLIFNLRVQKYPDIVGHILDGAVEDLKRLSDRFIIDYHPDKKTISISIKDIKFSINLTEQYVITFNPVDEKLLNDLFQSCGNRLPIPGETKGFAAKALSVVTGGPTKNIHIQRTVYNPVESIKFTILWEGKRTSFKLKNEVKKGKTMKRKKIKHRTKKKKKKGKKTKRLKN